MIRKSERPSITDVEGIRVGHATEPGGRSGCTVVMGPFRGAVEVPGMATGSRELDVLSPEHISSRVDALVLSGGSAFGLASADGVMAWLAEHGQGYRIGDATVPAAAGAVPRGANAQTITAGPNHACAVTEDNTRRCWGHNASGELGYRTAEQRIGDNETPAEMGDVSVF